MANAALKPKQVRVYLDSENKDRLEKLASAVESMSESALMTLLVSSALAAVARNNYKIPLPLRFQIIEDGYLLNEEKPKRR